MKKQTITRKLITVKSKREIKPRPLYQRENMEFFMTNGKATKASIEKFADDQFDHILANEKTLYINEFYLSKGVTYDTYHDWVKKNKYLRERHSMALEILGLRREKILCENNPAVLKLKQWLYDKDWDKTERRNAKLKSDADALDNKNITVLFKDYKNMPPTQQQ